MARARDEAVALLDTLGMEVLSADDERARGGDLADPVPIGDVGKAGSSTWQSLARDSGEVESDYLNGEIALLGRLNGIPTPVNAAIQEVARRAATERWTAGSLTVEAVTALVEDEIADRRDD